MDKPNNSDATKSKKKVGRPVTTGTGTPIILRLLPELLNVLDKQVRATGASSRQEVIRQILTAYFKRRYNLKGE